MKYKEKYINELVMLVKILAQSHSASNDYYLKDFKDTTGFTGDFTNGDLEKWCDSEYKQPYKLTACEKMILENINPKYEWIARTSCNGFFVMGECSIKEGEIPYISKAGIVESFELFSHMFPFVQLNFKALNIKDILNNCIIVSDKERQPHETEQPETKEPEATE